MLLLEPRDLADDVRAAFVAAHGRAPDVVGRAPGRVNLVGEHTDYHGGLCLPVALEHATWAAVSARADDVVRVRSTVLQEEWRGTLRDRPTGWPAYVVGTFAALGLERGADVLLDSTVPVGAGLSSSAALICSLATALSTLPAEQLLPRCVAAETEEVGAPTGGLDQSIALLAVPGHALLLDFGTGARRHVPWRPERAGLEVLVVDTRTRHAHADGGYRLRREESREAQETTPAARTERQARRLRHVASENERVLAVADALGRDDWAAVGRIFTDSHRSLRDDYEVSSPELDAVVRAAQAGGALGARMTGGGFGGCALVLSRRDSRHDVLAAVAEEFRGHGWADPRVLVATASGAARRV